MLESLVHYAQQEQLVSEPGFIAKAVHWLVTLDHYGDVLAVTAARPPKGTVKYPNCPDLQQGDLVSMPTALRKMNLNVRQAAHFLSDSCSRVVLMEVADDDTKTLAHHETFVILIELASQEVEALRPIHKFLTTTTNLEMVRLKLLEIKAKPTDKLSFILDGSCILEQTVWHDWWKTFRHTAFVEKQTQGTMISLAEGKIVKPVRIHSKLLMLGEKRSFGVPLITTNKFAFESYGLVAGQHAAMSDTAAVAYHAALEHLLQNAVKIAGVKLVYWYDQKLEPQLDILGQVLRSSKKPRRDPPEVSLERVIQDCMAELKTREIKYHLLIMREVMGRARILCYKTAYLKTALNGLMKWQEQTNLVGLRKVYRVSLADVINNLFTSQKKKSTEILEETKFNPTLIDFINTLLEPDFPVSHALALNLLQNANRSLRTEEALGLKGLDSNQLQTFEIQLGVLKAFLQYKGHKNILARVNLDYPNVTYLFGRLIAILESIRQIHVGRDACLPALHKLYLRACSSPQAILISQLPVAQRQLKTMAINHSWFRRYFQFQIQLILEKIQTHSLALDSLEKQILFLLGYYQQFVYNQAKLKNKPDTTEDLEISELDWAYIYSDNLGNI
ncbi:MAG: hypothetical protein RLZZ156_1458 [Deinococcota bacterium]|jgi:CRISPR-associated protein Csd1